MFKFVERFRSWRNRRYWEKQHMNFIRMMVQVDLRWLSVDPATRAVMERYEKVVSPDWYRQSHEDIGQFRKRIGVCPHENKGTPRS